MSRKDATRSALMVAALDLFAERGYDATTAAMIAARAGVTEMTFFRHFPSKSSVLIEDPYDPLIADAIRAQAVGVGSIQAAIGAIAAGWRAVPPPASHEVRGRLRIVSETPSLRGAIAENNARTESAIAAALVDRGESEADARIAAAAVMAALTAALLDWAAGDDPELGNAIDNALRVLRTGSR